jgi:hypothetical protein
VISPITTYSSNDIFLRDFVEGSSESEDTSFSEPSEISSDSSIDEERPKPKVQVKKSPLIVQTKSFSVTHVPIRKKIVKKDRFYDKSRDIPNDVYFGDVKGDETCAAMKIVILISSSPSTQFLFTYFIHDGTQEQSRQTTIVLFHTQSLETAGLVASQLCTTLGKPFLVGDG